MPVDLAEVATEELMKELQHRLDCLKKPEQRIILIGEQAVVPPVLHVARGRMCTSTNVLWGHAS